MSASLHLDVWCLSVNLHLGGFRRWMARWHSGPCYRYFELAGLRSCLHIEWSR